MAQKILLFFLIIFTGRVLQPAFKTPYPSVKAGKRKVFLRAEPKPLCDFKFGSAAVAFKSFSCFKKREPFKTRAYHKKIQVVFSATKKRKPLKQGSAAYIFIPLKNWGTLYFESDLKSN